MNFTGTLLQHDPPRIGLTGGIGCGKTTVARLFAERGVAVFDADQVARELLEPDQPALKLLVERYGPSLLQQGQLDRPALKRLIFSQPEERIWLDGVMHPLVYQRLEALMQHHSATPYHLLVIPLLIESGYRNFVDRLWVVDCPETVQRQRVALRDGLDDGLIDQIIASQCPRAERLLQADAVIDNGSASRTVLERQVARLHDEVLAVLRS